MTRQEEWDLLLITAFFRSPYSPASAINVQFGCHDPSLKRQVPFFQRNQAIFAFVENSLPAIYKCCRIYGERRAEEIAKKVSASKIDTVPMERASLRSNADHQKLYHDRKKMQSSRISSEIDKLQNRSAWHVCKE